MPKQPEWLFKRVNDPYGTPNKHEFWETVEFEKHTTYKVFERDGVWYAYDTQWNAWLNFPTREDAIKHCGTPGLDPWA